MTAVQGSHSRQSSSASTSDQDSSEQNALSSSDLKIVHEQRRVRHIASIVLRNLGLPEVESERQHRTPLRPTVRRSLSTTSSYSTHTIRRTPSNRTLRPSLRNRASSIVSIHRPTEEENIERQSKVYQPPSLFLPWDSYTLNKAVRARFAYAFVSLASVKDGRVIYRTPITKQSGLNHAWGRASGSDCDPDGIDLSQISNDDGCRDDLRISLWAASESHLESKTQDVLSGCRIYPGTEEEYGFSLVWEKEVSLQNLDSVEGELSSISLSLPQNSILLGFQLPLAQLHEEDREDGEQNDQNKSRKKGVINGISGGANAVKYYIINQKNSAEVEEPVLAPLHKSVARNLLKNGTLVRSYDIGDIIRILQFQRQMFEQANQIDNIKIMSDKALIQDTKLLTQSLQHAEEKERLKSLSLDRDATRITLKTKRKEIHERQEALHRRRARLEIARRLMINRQRAYDDLQRKLVQLSKVRHSIEAKIYARRVTLLRQVEYIYPIELIDGAQLLFSIVDIPLMNRDGNEETQNGNEKRGIVKADQSDDIVSSALGMVGQMVALISAYTDTPLHYPIATAGSRSVIQDGISVMSGPRAFPLYSKGVERYRFEYGHFLLNKDIEQLMNHSGITILDIRNTLPNLKNLIVTLTASVQLNSKLSRRNHVGSEMISLPHNTSKFDGLGMGRPTMTTSDESQQKGQIGYGSVMANETVQGTSKKPTARWGMSLLGWGNLPEQHDSSKSVKTQPSINSINANANPLPTIRTLGKTK